MISQEVSLSATWQEDNAWDTYSDVSWEHPLTATISTPLGWATTTIEVGMRNTAFPDWGFWVYDSAYCGQVDGASIGSSATGVWDFRPSYRLLVVELEGLYNYNYYRWEQDLDIALMDMTENRNLLTFDGGNFEYGEVPPRIEFEVDPMHVYRLTMSASGVAFLAKDFTVGADARVYTLPVTGLPDGSSTGGLLGWAFGGILLLRRVSARSGSPGPPREDP